MRTEFSLANDGTYICKLRANDLYDPEIALGGHQPRGFDEFMAIFDKFTVTGSNISATFMYEGYSGPSVNGLIGNLIQNTAPLPMSQEVPALPPVTVGIFKNTSTMGAGPAQEQMEKDRQRWSMITPLTGTKTLKAKLKCSEFFGKSTLVGSAGYSGDATKSPEQEIQWEVWAARNDDNYAAGAVKIPCYITMDYHCVFTEPKVLQAS